MKLLDNLRVFFDKDNEETLYNYWRAKAEHYEVMYKVKEMKLRVYWAYLRKFYPKVHEEIASRTEGLDVEELRAELIKLSLDPDSE